MTANPCIFCLDEQRLPHRISCGHSFCTECFQRYLELGRDSRCPLCRRDFRPVLEPSPLPDETSPEEPGPENEVDTLVLTLSEQECRFFEQLYGDLRLASRWD
ncbi:postreplication repair E3 ubiquitin-protein ligase RAD18 isoform X2 [Drosophila subpulchrella]|uniref:postreplication repair E3 ubiquitin-protein ligase RAD18 isoform X2 n=1 Tax=Drosophila subpulchrella TaxID=1486046 RepID=UPI0018A152E5|nr:postreplication repair E3 ubiquitin-protein ligase RAD18 isoform X2 [Drosophila subpulchrella]